MGLASSFSSRVKKWFEIFVLFRVLELEFGEVDIVCAHKYANEYIFEPGWLPKISQPADGAGQKVLWQNRLKDDEELCHSETIVLKN